MISSTPRCILIGEYVLLHRCTVREAARVFGVSKSTVATDLSVQLKKYNISLYEDVRQIMSNNSIEGRRRGGDVTKTRYKGKPLSVLMSKKKI